jgi:hypothetical protein
MGDDHKEDPKIAEDLQQLKTVVAVQGRLIRAAENVVAAGAVVGPLQLVL